MIKRQTLCIVILVFIIIVVGVLIILIGNNPRDNEKDSLVINTFEASEYEDYIKSFPSEEILGSISDEKDLLEKVEVILIENYGERIKNEKPYRVSYDKVNGIWLVQGTLHPNEMGGVANILVEGNTGKVLAMWHGK